MTLFKRLGGVFANPRPTFQAIAEKPVWVDILIVLMVALIAYMFVISPYTRHDQYQMMKDSVKLKERLGEERFNQSLQSLEGPPTTWQVIQTVVGTPLWFLLALLIQASVLILFARFVSSQGTFKQVFAALVHASAVNVLLGNAVRLALILIRKSAFQTSTSLAALFPTMEVMSKPYAILSQVDFFQLWMFGILAYGLSAILKVDLKKSLFISYSLWALKALVNIAIGLIGMSFVR